MNNFKKIGMTALAASLVSTSVFAGELAVTGSAGIYWENYKADSTGEAATAGTKYFSMGNDITFTGSGELDNGLNVAVSFQLDQGDNTDEDSTNAEDNVWDNHSVTISSDALGKFVFAGHGGSSAQAGINTTAAGDIWDLFDLRAGADSKMKESGMDNNMMTYTLPSIVDGLTVVTSYTPNVGDDESDTSYAFTYTGVEGLTASYGVGSNDDASGSTSNADATTMSLAYAYGPVTVAYSDHEYDSNTASEDQDVTSFKVSYTVSDAISISYGEEEMDSGTTTDQDAKYSKISASYTAGGMTVSGNMSEMENGDYLTTAAADEEYVGLGVSFAF